MQACIRCQGRYGVAPEKRMPQHCMLGRGSSLPHMSMQACTRCRQWNPSMLAPAKCGLARPAALGMLSPAGGMLCNGGCTSHWHAADRTSPGQASLLAQQRLLWSTAVASRLHPLTQLRRGMQVCRNYNFGKEGSSKGQYFYMFLAPTRLNDDAVPWPEMDLSYLQLPR